MSARSSVIASVRDRLARRGWPRLTVIVILSFAGGAAFLSSVAALRAGLNSMGLRYALAVAVGYAAFLLLVRAWIGMHRARWASNLDAVDTTDVADTLHDTLANVIVGSGTRGDARITDGTVDEPVEAFTGGSSGGGGGGAAWDSVSHAPAAHAQPARIATPRGGSGSGTGRTHGSGKSDGSGWSLDLDDAVWLIVAAAAALGALVCVGYVIYIAPLMLAEVAVDAALVSIVYRRLRREELNHWTGTIVRRTWMPAAGLLLFMAVAGFALQRVVPDAHSIGGVLRHLVS